jgi:hypothetical protein
MIAVLFVSTVAFASIEYGGSWTGYNGAIGDNGYTNASAGADGSTPSDWEAGEGDQSVWTTEAGDCDWSWDCSVYADWYIYWLDGGTCTASAGASADASFPGDSASFSVSVYKSADQSGGIGDDDWDADGDSGSGTSNFSAYGGLDASHWAAAGASAPSGVDNWVLTTAEASAYVTMSPK